MTLKRHGFTLAEVLIVVVILSVLVGMAIPRYAAAVERNTSLEGINILTALLGAQRRFALENGGLYTANMNDLDVQIPPPRNFAAPQVFNNSGGVASIVRKGNLYVLAINDQGVISCVGGAMCSFVITF